MINSVTLVGRLTKDPQLKYTPNGIVHTGFILAVNRTFSNQQGEREADFIKVRVWRKQAENVANYLEKGSLVGITGRLQTERFQGNDGKTVYTTEVVADSVSFLEPSKRNSQQNPPQQQQQQYQQQPQYNSQTQQQYQSQTSQQNNNPGDDLPF